MAIKNASVAIYSTQKDVRNLLTKQGAATPDVFKHRQVDSFPGMRIL